MTTTLTASTTAQLNQDIATADAATSGGFIIDLQGNITETAQLHAIDLQPGVPLTIDGSNGSGGVHRLDGAGSHGFLVDAGSVTNRESEPEQRSVGGRLVFRDRDACERYFFPERDNRARPDGR
jgi:hypothetical protein